MSLATTQLIGFGTPAPFLHAVAFDGSTYLTRGAGLTSAADSAFATFSFWFKVTGGDGTLMRFLAATNSGNYTNMSRRTSNVLRTFLGYTDGTGGFNETVSTYTTSVNTGWHHVLYSNWADGGANHDILYIDGTSVVNATSASKTIDWTWANWAIGANPDGTEKLTGALAQIYINATEFVDISNAANRAKFYNNGAVDFGYDGSLPTGTRPIVYLNNPAANFGKNFGTGGDFSVTAGTLTDTTPPLV